MYLVQEQKYKKGLEDANVWKKIEETEHVLDRLEQGDCNSWEIKIHIPALPPSGLPLFDNIDILYRIRVNDLLILGCGIKAAHLDIFFFFCHGI